MEHRRKKYFVKKKLQVKYLLFVLLAMLLPTILCSGALYYLIWQTIAAEVAIPEAIAETLIPALHKVNTILLITLPPVFLAMLFLAVIISNKIAGPVYRLERELKKIIGGDYTRRIHFRSKDELQEIAQGINELLEKVSPQKK